MAIFDKRSRSRVMNLLTFRDIRFLLIFRDLSKNSRKSAAPHFLVGAIFTEIVSRKSAAPHFLVGAIFTEIVSRKSAAPHFLVGAIFTERTAI